MVSPIPEGYGSVTCYLVVPNAKEAIAFYEKALGAESIVHMPGPNGDGTLHAEFRVGNTFVMISDENPAWNMKSAKNAWRIPGVFHGLLRRLRRGTK